MMYQSRGDLNYVGDEEGHPDAPANRHPMTAPRDPIEAPATMEIENMRALSVTLVDPVSGHAITAIPLSAIEAEARSTPAEALDVKRIHAAVCSIELGILTHIDGSNESGHDGEHPHPWPCERVAASLRVCGCRQWIEKQVADLWEETPERFVCPQCGHDYHEQECVARHGRSSDPEPAPECVRCGWPIEREGQLCLATRQRTECRGAVPALQATGEGERHE